MLLMTLYCEVPRGELDEEPEYLSSSFGSALNEEIVLNKFLQIYECFPFYKMRESN